MEPKLTPKYLKIHKEDIISWSNRLAQAGLLKGYEGSLSVRLGKEYILITRSLSDKGNLQADDIVLADMKGNLVSHFQENNGSLGPEFLLHKEVYLKCPDSRSVIYALPPYAILMTILNYDVSFALLPDELYYFGEIGFAKVSMPASPKQVQNIRPLLPAKNGILIQNQGALTHGADLNVTGCLMEMLEKICFIHYHANVHKAHVSLSKIPEEIAQELKSNHKSFVLATNQKNNSGK